MPISNSYVLERKSEKRKGLYEKTHNLSLILKIFFLLSLILTAWKLPFLALTVFLLVGDVTLSIARSKMVFTYVYKYRNGIFYVIKTALDGKEKVMEQVLTKDVDSCRFVVQPTNGISYFDTDDDYGADKPMEIVSADRKFVVLGDNYLYSLINKGKETV